MPIFIEQWRAEIGTFQGRVKIIFNNKKCSIKEIALEKSFFLIVAITLLIITHGDIELNPGPKRETFQYLKICHWNVNSLLAHNFQKVSLIEAYNSLHKHDFICISESFLDSSITTDDQSLYLNGYEMVRSDHPSDTKRGGVCIYYKDFLSVRIVKTPQIHEFILCEVTIQNKKGYVAVIYRSPSQDREQFESFSSAFEEVLFNLSNEKPLFKVIVGDFNARSSSWWCDDITTTEGLSIDYLTSQYGLYQIVSEPTHLLPQSASCIDLIFTDQPNLVVDSGTHPSLHSNCHHQITYCKLNLHIQYPPPYQRLVWNFKLADIKAIRRSLELVNWEHLFLNKSVHNQVSIFNKTLINVFTNFIPNKIITCNDKDPPWINDFIRKKIEWKNQLYRNFNANGKTDNDFYVLREATATVSKLISDEKSNYYQKLSKKLCDPKTNSKTYWSLLKTFYNGKKVPVIPPIIINNNIVSNIKQKADYFNDFFAQQCTPLNNDSKIPDRVHRKYTYTISSVNFTNEDILKIIRSLNPNKAHGFDDISIRMIQICDTVVLKPMAMIFKNCLSHGIFPNDWKKSNVVPIHKKGDKQELKNYRPISLLPIFGKIFERIIYNSLYSFVESNNLLCTNQSGFRSADSCVNQLLSITHLCYQSFDYNPSLEARAIFLDISKAFDKVWHEGLVFKLECIGVEGQLLKLLESFLNNRYQRVLLNGQSSNWSPIKSGVPQGSILGPLLFLIYINDLPDNLISTAKLFADDTSIISIVHDVDITANELNLDLANINEWAYRWKMSFNPDITKQAQQVIFSRKTKKPQHPPAYFNGHTVSTSIVQKHLGMYLDEKLDFNFHLKEKICKAYRGVGIIKKLQNCLDRKSLITIYKSFVRPHLDYGDIVFDQPNNNSFIEKLESVQYNAALAITGAIRGTSRVKLYKELGLESLSFRRWFRRLCAFYKIKTLAIPNYLHNIIPNGSHFYNTRAIEAVETFYCRTNLFKYSFFPYTIVEWNKLDYALRSEKSYLIFRKTLLQIGRPIADSVYFVHNPLGLKLLTRLRLGLSHLNEHRFNHNFQCCVNPLCSCSLAVESTKHFFLHCHHYSGIRVSLLNDVKSIKGSILNLSDDSLVLLLLYGDSNLNDNENSIILNATIKFLIESERFYGSFL